MLNAGELWHVLNENHPWTQEGRNITDMKCQHPVIIRLSLTRSRKWLARRSGQQDIDVA